MHRLTCLNCFRCESFNGTIRAHNIYANRHAPSKDIATSFAIQQSIRFVCSGGHFDPSERYVAVIACIVSLLINQPNPSGVVMT